jgi:hypothetical protein
MYANNLQLCQPNCTVIIRKRTETKILHREGRIGGIPEICTFVTFVRKMTVLEF